MKLTTLNLQGFIDWEQRQPAIEAYLQSIQPDVILFQEVVYLPDISTYNQVQILNDTLNYAFENCAVTRLQSSKAYGTYREGLAILSKHPIVKADTIILKQALGDEHNRIVQLIDIRVRDDIVKLANVHFSLTDTVDFATAHLKETLEILSSRNEERIIAGDFNIDHLEELSDVWSDQYRASTEVPYISYPYMHKRNDYVLIPKKYSFTDISTSGDELSDHRAVTTEIRKNSH